jgi:hypothetical protein
MKMIEFSVPLHSEERKQTLKVVSGFAEDV